MGWFVRTLACGAAASVVACATLAGLEEPEPQAGESNIDSGGRVQDTGTAMPPEDASPPPADSSTIARDAAVSDAPSDAPKSDGCTLGQSSDPCSKGGDCCSTKCGEARQCVSTCKTSGSSCDPTSSSSCCVGMWCSGGSFQCSPCILSGQQAANAGGIPLSHSCCSRTLKILSSECQ